MKKFIFLAVFLALSCYSWAQKDSLRWKIHISYGMEESDKRLYTYRLADLVLANNPERWGVHHFEMSLNYIFLKNKYFVSSFGLGLAKNTNTFRRPFDHLYFIENGPKSIEILKSYNIDFVTTPFVFELALFKPIYFHGRVTPSFEFYKYLDRTLPMGRKNKFDFYSLELSTGISYHYKNFEIGFSYRYYQIKKIDKVLFFDVLFYNRNDPRKFLVWEEYNPQKFTLTIGHQFDWH